MGYAVLHFNKAKGSSEARMTAHIERRVNPPNADKNRTHLNRELVEFPSGVTDRTQAIQHRIRTAGIKRKVTSDQVRVIRVNVSGTHEDMVRIIKEGRIDEWCGDNLDYFKREFGEKNIVSAVLHMDEKTPHIHIALVPIVTGKRRKAKEGAKKKDTVRLCVDDVLTKTKMVEYQDSYALAMAKYGLQRGIRGSEARHRTTAQYYRDTLEQGQAMEEKIGQLEEERQEVYEKVRDMYDRKDEARDKFLNMHEYGQQKEQEISIMESRIEQLKQDYEPYKAQDDLNLLFDLFPKLGGHMETVQLCKSVGLETDAIKKIFKGESVIVSGKLHSPEHDQSFSVQNAKLQLVKERDNPGKIKLYINGQNITGWFRQMYQELKQPVRPHIRSPKKPNMGNRKGINR